MGHHSLCHALSGISGNSSKALGSSGQGGGQVAFVRDHSGRSHGGEGRGPAVRVGEEVSRSGASALTSRFPEGVLETPERTQTTLKTAELRIQSYEP